MRRLFALLLVTSLAMPAGAQITVTHADLEAAFSIDGTNNLYSTESSTQLAAIAAQTGANQTWDFTGLAYDPVYVSTVERVQPPVPGSSDPHLAQATHIFRVANADSVVYTFQGLSATEATFLGVAGPSVLVRFVPFQRSAVVPFTMGSAWSSTYESQFEPGFPPEVTMSTTETTEVVGWGTLVTPAGSTPALMIRTENTTTLSFPPLPPIITTSTEILFTRYGTLNANIFLADGFPASGDYNHFVGGTATAPPPGGAALSLVLEGEHPVSAGADVRLAYTLAAPARVALELFDAMGRRLWSSGSITRAAGVHRVAVGSHSLRTGPYVARLTAGDQSATRTIIIVR